MLSPTVVRDDPDGLEDFFENGAIALHVVSGDGTILRANKAELDLLGYSAAEYIGRSITDFHADAAVITDILTRLTRGETLRSYAARLRARDGSIKHVEITSSGRFHNQDLLNTRCFTLDVTERIALRAEVRRKHDLLHQVLEALPAPVFMTDAVGVITYCNRAAVDMAREKPKLNIDSWHTVFPLFTLDGVRIPLHERPMYQVLKGMRATWGTEVLAQRADDQLMPVMLFPTPIHDENGELTGAVNMFVDLRERNYAEEMFRLAVEAAPNAMLLIDGTGRITLVNQAAERLFGYDRSELQGEPVETLIPIRSRAEHTALRERFASTPRVRAMGTGLDLLALRKDGTEIPVEIGLSPVQTSRGLMVFAAVIDISVRQRAAERETLLHRELHHRTGNLFAIVHAVVSRTLADDVPIGQARGKLQARLNALARAHHKLAAETGAQFSVDAIIKSELEPFAACLEVCGPPVSLEPTQIQNISLALHELTTNAVKHGALSVPQGKIRISWHVEPHDEHWKLCFRWEERDGPLVAVPTRRGFGGSLLKTLFANAELDFAPEGLRYEFEISIAAPGTEDIQSGPVLGGAQS